MNKFKFNYLILESNLFLKNIIFEINYLIWIFGNIFWEDLFNWTKLI